MTSSQFVFFLQFVYKNYQLHNNEKCTIDFTGTQDGSL